MPFQTNPEIDAIFDAMRGSDNLMIEAAAGAGKTTTLIELLRTLPVTNPGSFLPPAVTFLAFNSAIAEQLSIRCPKHVSCATFHKHGRAALVAHINDRSITGRKDWLDSRKVAKLVYRKLRADDDSALNVIKLVDLLKSYSPFSDHGGTNTLADELNDLHDLLLSKAMCDLGLEVLDKSCADISTIDFSDMLYLPIVFGAKFSPQDFVFVDEAQDVNEIQMEILDRLKQPNIHVLGASVLPVVIPSSTRYVFVGDPHQAIYGFRGAGADSMTEIQARFACSVFPLSYSRRCPKAVVAEAQKYLNQPIHERTY